eukprot:TRINITY_DN3047_c0_g1_i1.p1 TRINITY_DN3047_c0_g1~~TRINITY_DN3047_c0_g1_i1.p1  ORF type:complete len:219 (+),score=63.45 TRINITY_DN3047_c0_g1_i1:84-740(+)
MSFICCAQVDESAPEIFPAEKAVDAAVVPAAEPPAAEPEVELKAAVEPPFQYTVTVKKEAGGKLGMNVDSTMKQDAVMLIEPNGLIAQYNATADQKVQQYDRIVKMGDRMSPDKSELLASVDEEVMEIIFERPKIQEVSLSRKGRELGLIVEDVDLSHGVLITKVTEGAISDCPAGTFNEMDRIVHIDGKVYEGKEMLTKLQAETMEDFAVTVVSYSR